MAKSVQKFGNGESDAEASSEAWGGKGAGLMRMAAEGLPVPPGFTLTTALCGLYQKHPSEVMDAVMTDVADLLGWLKESFGYMPLLSVRSGARVSMPGMMDTILNVGATKAGLGDWGKRLNAIAARDSYRRLLQMLGDTALGIEKKEFDTAWAQVVGDKKPTAALLDKVIARFETLYSDKELPVPETLEAQLRLAIEAVFKSWNSPRAIEYRKLENIPGDWGTAVTIQAMVFGNMNDKSGSGVLFSRNPSTGEPGLYGEFLPNAQGEDVVAGTHTPIKVQEMKTMDGWGGTYNELNNISYKLEQSRKDMQDMEFTVQDGKLFMLQTRNGKRSAQAAFRIASDMRDEGLISEAEMFARISPKQYKVVKRPQIDPAFKDKPTLTGIAASMGVATGKVVFSSVEAAQSTEPVILVTEETTPDDIAGMAKAVGILTKTGGATSHAAVVARGMDKPCVVGCTELTPASNGQFKAGQVITICGATGRVWSTEVPVMDASNDPYVAKVIDALLASKGVIEQSADPKANACIALGDWMAWTDEAIVNALNEVEAIVAKGDWVLLDASFGSGGGNDNLLWGIAGPGPEELRFKEVLALVAARNLKGVFVVGNNASSLIEAGAEDIPTAKTIEDLMTLNGMVRLHWQLLPWVGGPDAVKKMMDGLRSSGAMTATIMDTPMTRDYAAFVLLKAA